MARYRTILLFGAPGAGKGTQGKILGSIPGFYHLSCGDVFRSLDMATPLGKVFVEFSSKGMLVPDEHTIQMWHQNMHARTVLSIYKPHIDLLVLDGIPRNVTQAKLLERHLKVLKIIHLVCPDKERMLERLRRRAIKENRVDDAKEEVIRKRWSVYEEETFPVLECYDKSLIAEIDAMDSPAAVLEKVLEVLVPVQNEHFLNPANAVPDSLPSFLCAPANKSSVKSASAVKSVPAMKSVSAMKSVTANGSRHTTSGKGAVKKATSKR